MEIHLPFDIISVDSFPPFVIDIYILGQINTDENNKLVISYHTLNFVAACCILEKFILNTMSTEIFPYFTHNREIAY